MPRGAPPDQELDPAMATRYRAVTARLNYLAHDRPDVRFAVSSICCAMASPTVRDLERLKRVLRYLKGRPRALCMYVWQEGTAPIRAWSDSDWAGDRTTRKSTSGVCLFIGRHFIKGMTKRQRVIALSSAEAELYAAVLTASEAMGLQALSRDMGVERKIALSIDASAAIALLHREGLGKAKHVEVQSLWLQTAVREKKIILNKVGTNYNTADLFTKGLSVQKVEFFLKQLGYYFM